MLTALFWLGVWYHGILCVLPQLSESLHEDVAVRIYETSIYCNEITRRYIHTRRCENLNSHNHEPSVIHKNQLIS
jgi:hypothetical protein